MTMDPMHPEFDVIRNRLGAEFVSFRVARRLGV